MKIAELKEFLREKNIRPGYVSFTENNTPMVESYCISFDRGVWEIYYYERDNKNNLQRFFDEESACSALLAMLAKDGQAFLQKQ